MSNETLLSLSEFEEQQVLDKQENTSYNLQIVEKEITLICALTLTAPDILEPEGYTTEAKNENFLRIWRPFYLHSHRRNMALSSRLPNFYLGEEQLPDVCTGCFRTVGFCTGGRLRFYCRECYSESTYLSGKLSISRRYYPNRICSSGHTEPIFAQLIYKYLSPNGDRSWVMKPVLTS